VYVSYMFALLIEYNRTVAKSLKISFIYFLLFIWENNIIYTILRELQKKTRLCG
jgi:hypothetical protein